MLLVGGEAMAAPLVPPVASPTTPASRFRIQHKADAHEILSAYISTEDSLLSARSGRQLHVHPGDYVVLQGASGGLVLDVLTPELFAQIYEALPEPGLALTPADHAELEKLLGFGSTRTSATLVLAVQHLARLSVGDVPINFTPAQWEELARRAEKRGQPLSLYMARLVERFTADLWAGAI